MSLIGNFRGSDQVFKIHNPFHRKTFQATKTFIFEFLSCFALPFQKKKINQKCAMTIAITPNFYERGSEIIRRILDFIFYKCQQNTFSLRKVTLHRKFMGLQTHTVPSWLRDFERAYPKLEGFLFLRLDEIVYHSKRGTRIRSGCQTKDAHSIITHQHAFPVKLLTSAHFVRVNQKYTSFWRSTR